ncbi:hypothetical protein ASPACDRAFT_1897078 [Aspergillus aculeatus ATCC 16872]|uniref:Zn(2)-C6 fungal-type domain-containing protein n=1 Tax=Aspergillus aculeatus (strain ATCC 16872 / CBS 172.66 / WB 5094) TaxID=690307 RepID=A0A1L9X085_ASPA1|nr:uncharacterized protein ASPACDRAFT_1897078 [Aspergillus aculeatus ATCC 16872]OJK01927.1 hypothetical protein ASPACDRAFT_1897078 [Aspergillus aculeatus ATCC 16872]
MQSPVIPVPQRRRARIPLSCDPCRTRKLKCNREYPCQNCIARGEQSACHFKGAKIDSLANARRERQLDPLRQRIDQLENMVKRLIAHRTPESPKPGDLVASDTKDVAAKDVASAGKIVLDGAHSVYQGGDDWYDVLEEINQLKNTWAQAQDDRVDHQIPPTQSQLADGSSLLFGQVKPIDRIEILATLPPKRELDTLVAIFFDRPTFPIAVPPIIHEPTFMREYHEHGKNPSQANFIWLGLLFSILGIVMLAYHQHGEPPQYEGRSESLFQLYRIRTAQCLLSGDIAKCLPYTVETLRFNATAELNRKDDNRRGLWIMTGVLVRTAINMGYHREPAHSSPPIPPLQAEYRRRIWLAVISMDNMASFRAGLPRMLSAIYSDTREPRNLHDWELPANDATAASLPPPRPLTEPTAVTYLIVKGRLCHALGRVADLTCNPTPSTYADVLTTDRILSEAYNSFPPHMQPPPLTPQPPAPPQPPEQLRLSYAKIGLWFIYHRAVCTLHRRFLAQAKMNPHYRFSRDRCLGSARALLAAQRDLSEQWYRFAHTRQTLSFAAMVVFLELELLRQFPGAEDAVEQADLVRDLETSVAQWEVNREICDEAGRQWQVLAGMLEGVRGRFGAKDGGDGGGVEAASADHASALGLWGPPSQMPVVDSFTFENELATVEIDWAAWDSYIEDAGFGSGPIY